MSQEVVITVKFMIYALCFTNHAADKSLRSRYIHAYFTLFLVTCCRTYHSI